MKISNLAAFAVFTLFQVTLQNASAAIYEYDWVGGQPGFSGQIFLDAPSSALAPNGGNDADVLPGSFVSTPLGTFSVLDRGLDAVIGPGGFMSWDASHISFMMLLFQPTTPINHPYFNQPAIGCALAGIQWTAGIEVGSIVGGYSTVFSYDDFSGNWEAVPVPEPSALGLLAVGAIALLVCRRRNLAA
jgi:hypothetical protein